ncbi:hypoxanthine-guanine phosphoribosyltransferase [Lobosporangium transversale]|uniref:Phosphoribosyltransferase-like protein n=1 Tax=Lobosporangium transversale TaxID=64571 RepID=A0A1Y2GAB4_9FUNG|nr:phosphoribosyltransferase-like protein [Lobosporangium transversale]KAF9917046.1 hypoxanthine-guanine phosphoribosyltransferase [Lobosporangium transversale]ORZ05483.1 phosphoribosyltransferase-like protein [Lobosporangium transversale]|eukprot:XP_021877057.1 phosphoribosyltransferase-like protein [Lobosporangium transversale]
MSKIHVSYNQIHSMIKETVENMNLNDDFQPDIMVAIGGGGFIPARILRTFLKKKNNKNISIQAIGLSLYEDLEIWKAAHKDDETSITSEPEVIKTQWLNFDSSETSLIGRNILIVDEVDDTRRTLAYAVRELTKDLELESEKLRKQGKEVPETKIGIFVLHNKLKKKREELPKEIMEGRYFACKEMPDQWLVYPWDALDIEEHTEKSRENTY